MIRLPTTQRGAAAAGYQSSVQSEAIEIDPTVQFYQVLFILYTGSKDSAWDSLSYINIGHTWLVGVCN